MWASNSKMQKISKNSSLAPQFSFLEPGIGLSGHLYTRTASTDLGDSSPYYNKCD